MFDIVIIIMYYVWIVRILICEIWYCENAQGIFGIVRMLRWDFWHCDNSNMGCLILWDGLYMMYDIVRMLKRDVKFCFLDLSHIRVLLQLMRLRLHRGQGCILLEKTSNNMLLSWLCWLAVLALISLNPANTPHPSYRIHIE